MRRRDFIALTGLGLGAFLVPADAFAGPFQDDDFAKLIPPDKKLSPEWLASLTARGEPEVYRGDDLRYIGMPVGGICTGTLYLGGDGKLWLWNVFNHGQLGISTKSVGFRGGQYNAMGGATYIEPLEQQGPVSQGFVLSIKKSSGDAAYVLGRDGFKNVTFQGQYPVGTITYNDPDVPVSINLDAYSPFIPLNADDSGLPATVLSFTVKNTSSELVEGTLAGWLENAVCHRHRNRPGTRRNKIVDGVGKTFLECSVVPLLTAADDDKADVLFDDWAREAYAPWKVEGTAFGTGPLAKSKIPSYQGDIGGPGARVVNSHAAAPGERIADKDAATGKLTSPAFKIERKFIRFWIGGGSHAGKTSLNLLVEGQVVLSETGKNNNAMRLASFDVRPWLGKEAVLEVVDAATKEWGNIGIGTIVFSDQPDDDGSLTHLPDYGTMGLALLGAPAEFRQARENIQGEQTTEAEASLDEKFSGALGRAFKLAPNETATINFVVTWHFPNLELAEFLQGRYYAARFSSAREVARYVADNFDRLSAQTKLWRETWNDSTLPYWFLNRTFANTSILATTTCYRLKDGRFYGWEGVGCCPGTCTHVWHYAQAMARIFPEIERDERERIDFGSSLDPKSGVIGFRGEFARAFAADGQAGTILRAYREHQMSADDAFLRRNWPAIRLAMQCLIDKDGDGDGILHGPLHNTLDADWYGVVPWLVGLYHAALRASEEMANEVGDRAFAHACRRLFERGTAKLDELTFRDNYGYYVHVGDPKHASEVGAYDGCHIDQVFGQSWAHQLGLGAVMNSQHVRTALESLWKYNFTPDVGPLREARRPGRWYAMPGDGGLVMVTFPFAEEKEVRGAGAWSAMYFNECMSGFEWQVAGHMIWAGMVTEGLAIARAIHDRYHPRLRNPYNEIECSDHYARAMASYGAFVAVCGFEFHGPKRHIGFAPQLTPEDFRAGFTAAEGWGTYWQRRQDDRLSAGIELKWGELAIHSISLEVPEGFAVSKVSVTAAGKPLVAQFTQDGARLAISIAEIRIAAGQGVTITVT